MMHSSQVALLAHLPGMSEVYVHRHTILMCYDTIESQIALGTGFGQVFRGIGACPGHVPESC